MLGHVLYYVCKVYLSFLIQNAHGMKKTIEVLSAFLVSRMLFVQTNT